MNWKAFKQMTLKQQVFTVFIMVFIILPIFFVFILPLAIAVSGVSEKKKYKKIIKKGILWNTEYLIEKD
jgi:hypothetical protein